MTDLVEVLRTQEPGDEGSAILEDPQDTLDIEQQIPEWRKELGLD